MTADSRPHIAILGAGPIGLEAALAAHEANFPFTLYETAPGVAGNIRAWSHVRLFSPWSMNASDRMRRHLRAAGREVPDGDACPTGGELLERVLEPLAGLPAIAPRLEPGTRVLAVGREGLLKHEEIATPARAERPFRLLLADDGGSEHGGYRPGERVARADVVLDCTGTYGHPNALGDGGIPAPGERQLNGAITYGIPDIGSQAEAWAGRCVLLVGGGHSAQTAARDLAELAREAPETRVIWAVRSPAPGWKAVPDDPLPERAALTARARELAEGGSPAVEVRSGVVVERLEPAGDEDAGGADGGPLRVVLRQPGGGTGTVEVDRVLALTGSVGDHTLYRQLQVHECYATSGPMNLSAALLGESGASGVDCLEQTSHGVETLENPEPRFFILGEKSYGRHADFLMRIGWQQVDEVFGALTEAEG